LSVEKVLESLRIERVGIIAKNDLSSHGIVKECQRVPVLSVWVTLKLNDDVVHERFEVLEVLSGNAARLVQQKDQVNVFHANRWCEGWCLRGRFFHVEQPGRFKRGFVKLLLLVRIPACVIHLVSLTLDHERRQHRQEDHDYRHSS
jgi:hypothetical protein